MRRTEPKQPRPPRPKTDAQKDREAKTVAKRRAKYAEPSPYLETPR